MTDVGRDHHNSSNAHGAPSSPPSPTVAVFAVVLLAGLGAAGAAYGLGDLLGLGVGAGIALAGAVVAAVAAGKSAPPDVKAIALLDVLTAEDAPSTPPSRFRGEPWASLYLMAIGDAEAQRTATLAIQEVERLRRELEQKPVSAAAAAFEPGPSYANDELVGAGHDSELSTAVAEPAVTNDRAAALQALAEALDPIREELSTIERELEPVVASLCVDGSAALPVRDSTPAKMVDALVQTAADGIEDMAAGLMRANELAGVAERVTNRATLLALNAALEATRSGSEAFASIAEETRRLAEYAREATDTISRLSSEIEIKVGETISSIQTSSEDAKAAVASIGSGTGSASRGVAPETVTALQALLLRVRTLRERIAVREEASVVAPAPTAPESRADTPEIQEEEPAMIHATFVEAEERVAAADTAVQAPAEPAEGPPQPVEGPPQLVEADASAEPLASAESPAPAEPVAYVEPKIPDWLEGIEPRQHG